MKKITIIFISIFLIGACYGQDSSFWDEVDSLLISEGYDLSDTVSEVETKVDITTKPRNKKSQDLPSANKNVLDFVDSHVGQKVGHGECFYLVDAALKTVNKNWGDRGRSKYVYGKEVNKNDVMPGDIIEYIGVTFADGSRASSHVAIVYSVGENGNIEVAEQNYNCKTVKDSRVVINKENLSRLIKGKLKFYRPY